MGYSHASYPALRTSVFAGLSLVACLLLTAEMRAANFVQANAANNWSLTTGWTPAGTPNSFADTISFAAQTANRNLTQDIVGGVSIGGIYYGGTPGTPAALGAFNRQVITTNSITLGNDGGGPGFASVVSQSSTASANNALFFTGAGGLILADDVRFLITSTASTNVNGALQLSTPITGTGNVTFNSAQNTVNSNTDTRGIWVSGTNTFVGNVLIERGLVFTNTSLTPFGSEDQITGNIVTIGSSGNSAALLSRDNVSTIDNRIVVAAISGAETRTFGSLSNSSYTASTGSILLNGNLDLRAGNTSTTAIHTYTGIISGAGGINKTGTAIAALTGNNTYTGKTNISAGTLAATSLKDAGVNSSLGAATGANAVIGLGNTTAAAALAYAGTGDTTNRIVDLRGTTGAVAIDQSGTGLIKFTSNMTATGSGAKTLTFQGSSAGVGEFAGAIIDSAGGATSLAKAGTGIWTLSGANTYTGTTTVSGGILQFAQTAALYNGNVGSWTDTNMITNSGGTMAFNVGGAGEFTTANIDSFLTLGTATTGFRSGSAIGIDTTNNAGTLVYSTNIANPNAGVNALGLTKLGANTLQLTGNNSYSGPTTIVGGTLLKGAANAIPSGTAIVFGNLITENTAGTLDLGTFDQNAASISVVSNSTTPNSLVIGSGKTLTVATGAGSPTNIVSIGGGLVGTNARLNVTGAGTMTVNAPDRNIVVALTGASGTSAALDMSGLANFNATVANIAIGRPTTTAGAIQAGSVVGDVMRLANNSNTLNVGGDIVIGSTSSTGTNSSAGGTLLLGTTNTISANQWVVGGGRAGGVVAFDTGLVNPTATLYGALGVNSRTNITLGDGGNVLALGSGTGGSTAMTGTMDFTGGTLHARINNLVVGNGASAASNTRGEGNGVFTFGGAGSSVNVNNLTVGRTANSTTANSGDPDPTASNSTMTVDGGELVVNSSMIIAQDLDTSATANGTQHVAGTFNLNGGSVTIGSVVTAVDTYIGNDAGANPGNITAVLNINGGTYTSHGDLRETTFPAGTLTSTLNLNGGTLNMTGDRIGVSGALINNVNLQSGTLKNVGQINNGIGITKSAGGTDVLTISGNNSFTGPVVINSGALNFAESSSHNLGGFGAITVADNTTLGVKAFSSATTPLTSGGTLTLGSVSGGSLNLTLAGNPTAPLMSVASVTTNGLTTVNVASTYGMTSGTYTLIDYSWALDGQGLAGLTLGSLPPRTTSASLVHNVPNTSIDLNITTDSIRWNGTTNVWDINTTANWKTIGGGSTTTYLQPGAVGEPVRFDDMAAANFNVNVSTSVNPVSITFDNNAANHYTLSGTGDLGTEILRKRGSANATISTSGALSIAAMDLDGTGAVIINRTDNPTLASTLSGTGTLRKLGANTLTLSGDSSGFVGTIDVANGTLSLGHANALGASTTNVAGGAALELNGKTLVVGAGLGGVTLTGGGNVTSSVPGTLLAVSNTTISTPITGSTTLSVDAPGSVVTVMGSSSYTGRTLLTRGTLAISGGNDRLPTSTVLTFNPENIADATATFNLGANNQTLANIAFPTSGTSVANNPPRAITLNVAGSGTLTVNGGQDMVIGAGGADSLDNATAHNQTLNMSGLGGFVFNNPSNSIRFALTGNRATKATQVATVNFANTNTITAAYIGLADSGGGAGGGKTTARLGQTNVWNTAALDIGITRADADVRFATGLVNPTITLRGVDGTSPLPSFRIGLHNDNSGTRVWDDVVDFSAGTTDAVVSTMLIGAATPSSATRDGHVNGSFILGAGSFTVNDLTLGAFLPTAAGNGTDSTMSGNGTFTLNNAGGTLLAQTIRLAEVSLDGANGTSTTVSGTLNVLNGLVKANTITRGLQNDPGVVSTARVDFSGGTIQNYDGSNLTINDVNVRMLSATGTSTLNVTGSNNITLNAGSVVSGAGTITKTGTGTLIYQGVNSHGGTIVNAGVAKVEGAGAFSAVGQLGTNGSGVVDLNGTNQTVGRLIGTGGTITSNSLTPVTLTVGGGDMGGGEYLGSIAESIAPPVGDYNANGVVDAADYVLWRRDPGSYGGPGGYDTWRANFGSTGSPGGAITLVKTGLGEVATAGTNTYTGTTTVNAGALTFGKPTALYNNQPSLWNNTKISVAANATLGFGVGGVGSFTESQVQTYMANINSGLSVGSSIGISPAVASYTYGTVISDSAVGMTGLSKLGPNTLVLNLNNTYTGNTHVYDGTLSVAQIGNIVSGPGPLGTPASAAQAAVRLGSAAGVTGTLKYTGAGETTDRDFLAWGAAGANGAIEAAGTGALTLTGGLSAGNAGAKTITLTGTNLGNNTISGVVSDGSATLSLAKTGSGLWKLANSNTYSGTTSVSAGTLEVNGGHTGNGNVAVTGGTLKINSNWTGSGQFNVGTGAGAGGHIIVDSGASVGNTPNMFVGSQGGSGTFTQTNGNVTIENNPTAGQYEELYVGNNGGTGVYNLQVGTLSLPTDGYINIGRDGGTGTFHNAASVSLTHELRIGANYDGVGMSTGTFNNLSTGSVTAGNIILGAGGFFVESSGTYTQSAGASTVVTGTGDIFVGDHGIGHFNHNGGTVTIGGGLIIGNWNNGNGTFAQGTYTQTDGSATFGEDIIIAWDPGTKGVVNLSGASSTLSTNTQMYVGLDATDATFNMSAGTVTIGGFTSIARSVGSAGQSNISGGSLSVVGDYNVGDYGSGVLMMTGGTVATTGTGSFIVAWQPTSTGVATFSNGTIDSNRNVLIGNNGNATFNMSSGTVYARNTGNPSSTSGFIVGSAAGSVGVANITGGTIIAGNPADPLDPNGADLRAGSNGMGTINMSGGTARSGDWVYIGTNSTSNGILNLSGTAMWMPGDNMAVGLNAGSKGVVNMTGGTIETIGNDPVLASSASFGTGNLIVSRSGTGTFNMSNGLVDLKVQKVSLTPGTGSDDDTFNSVSASLAFYALVPVAGGPLRYALDGNLYVAEQNGLGRMTMTGGTVNVGANVFVGGFNSSFAGGNGTLNIKGGTINVGAYSPTKGDFILGSPATSPVSQATVNLQGGVLDVSQSVSDGMGGFWGGNIASGGASAVTAFNFTGGTLKVRAWNTPGPFGGDLGDLKQNGTGSLLDITGNNTTLLQTSKYDLGAGTATIGSGRTFTTNGILNSAGAGVINVGQGGAAATLSAGSDSIAVDTLNLNNASVTAGGGITVATALTGNGTFNNSVTMGAGADVSPGLSIGTLNFLDDLTLDAAGEAIFEFNGNSLSDKIVVGDILTFAGELKLNVIGATPTVGQAFDIFDWFGGTVGTFATVPSPAYWDTSDLYTLGVVKFVSLPPGSGAGLDGGAVPEPGTLISLLFGLAALLCSARHRNPNRV